VHRRERVEHDALQGAGHRPLDAMASPMCP
jgi:hypothetical protein